VWLREDGPDPDWRDYVGHGTAVAAAVREKAPDSELLAVRVFARRLVTGAATLAEAIRWAARAGARLINVSLGTGNPAHLEILQEALEAAGALGALVVGAAEAEGVRFFPGSLPGAVGVRADPACSRHVLHVGSTLGEGVWAAPVPRPIPGVPEEANLRGVSFAVANATGLLALVLEGAPEVQSVEALHERLGLVAASRGAHGPV
jgi:subtilisin family serine protease